MTCLPPPAAQIAVSSEHPLQTAGAQALSTNPADQLVGIASIRALLAAGTHACLTREEVARDVTLVLVHALSSASSHVVVESLRALHYVTLSGRSWLGPWLREHVVSKISQFIGSDDLDVRAEALRLLRKMVTNNRVSREEMRQMGVMDRLIAEISGCAETDIDDAHVELLAVLCVGIDEQAAMRQEVLVPLFIALARTSRLDIIQPSLDGLSFCCFDRDSIEFVLSVGFLPRLIELAQTGDSDTQLFVVHCFIQLLSSHDRHTQQTLDSGILPILVRLLDADYILLRKAVCLALSNVAAGTYSQINALLATGVMPKIIELAQSPDAPEGGEAVWVIANCIASASDEQQKVFIQNGFVSVLIGNLYYEDARLLDQILSSLCRLSSWHKHGIQGYHSFSDRDFKTYFDEPACQRLKHLAQLGNNLIRVSASQLLADLDFEE